MFCFWLWVLDAPGDGKAGETPPYLLGGPEVRVKTPEDSLCCGPTPTRGPCLLHSQLSGEEAQSRGRRG